MKLRRFVAKDMRTALQEISKELGPDAAIVSSRRTSQGVELLAAIDYDPAVLSEKRQSVTELEPEQNAKVASITDDEEWPDDRYERTRTVATKSTPAKEVVADSGKLQIEFGNDPGLLSLREEMRQLRGLFEEQMQGLAWKDHEKRHPMKAWLSRRLSLLELSPRLREHYANTQIKEAERALAQALAAIAGDIQLAREDVMAHGGMYALVGATGVGKTTTAAKLAAKFALIHGAHSVALVSTDNFRIAAHDQLRLFARLIGCAFRIVDTPEQLPSVLDGLVDKRLVIIDSAGMSQRDQRLHDALLHLRSSVYPLKHLLVMSATSQRAQLQECTKQFGVNTLTGAILTKLDEATSLGPVISALIESRLPLYFACDGQRVPEDLKQWRGPQLIDRARRLAEQYQEGVDDWLLAQQLKVGTNASA